MTDAARMPNAHPGEIIPLCFDFTDEIGDSGDSPAITITNSIVTIEVDQSLWRGSDPDVATRLIGVAEVQGTQVLQAVEAGVDGVDYKVRCRIDINSVPAARLYKSSILPVRNQ